MQATGLGRAGDKKLTFIMLASGNSWSNCNTAGVRNVNADI